MRGHRAVEEPPVGDLGLGVVHAVAQACGLRDDTGSALPFLAVGVRLPFDELRCSRYGPLPAEVVKERPQVMLRISEQPPEDWAPALIGTRSPTARRRTY